MSDRGQFLIAFSKSTDIGVRMGPTLSKDSSSVQEIVSNTDLFGGVPLDAIHEIIAVARPINLRKGQRLFSRGDPGQSMFIIVKGSIEISLTSSDGRKISLNVMEPGQCLGEIGMIDGHPRSADAVATLPSSLLAISSDGFLATARKHPDLALGLARMLSKRVRWVSDSVEDFALLSIDRRLARRLLVLFDRFGDKNGVVAISQGDLADFAGATRETTNRVLAAWRKRGWISIHRKRIAITMLEELDRFAMSGTVDGEL